MEKPWEQEVPLAPYATLNRRWQAVIERRTFSTIRILTATQFKEFKEFFGPLHASRISYGKAG
jgi:hypothetical protein